MDRMGMINMLLAAEEQVNTAYIQDQIDADSWAKTLRDLDEKLSVLGLRFAFRPWENATPGKAKPF